MKEEIKRAVKCFAGMHEWIDRSNTYIEQKQCKHCGLRGKTRLKMTHEDKKNDTN